jgi:hypothetical protein
MLAVCERVVCVHAAVVAAVAGEPGMCTGAHRDVVGIVMRGGGVISLVVVSCEWCQRVLRQAVHCRTKCSALILPVSVLGLGCH